MIRVPTPHDHNDTTLSFRRNSNEGALCFGDDCKATEVHKITPCGLYVVFALMILSTVVTVLAIAKNKDFPSDDYVAQEVKKNPCGAGQVAQWEDSFIVECIKETR